jgi:hypothetical protein
MGYDVPYFFVLNNLYPLRPTIKKMLGGYALYLNKKLIIFLRDNDKSPEYNGVYIATVPEFFLELQQEIHTSKMEFDLDGSKNSWIFISEDLADFEQKVMAACMLIKNNDARIGKI